MGAEIRDCGLSLKASHKEWDPRVKIIFIILLEIVQNMNRVFFVLSPFPSLFHPFLLYGLGGAHHISIIHSI